MEFLEQAEFWHWWIAAILFLVLETFAPVVARLTGS